MSLISEAGFHLGISMYLVQPQAVDVLPCVNAAFLHDHVEIYPGKWITKGIYQSRTSHRREVASTADSPARTVCAAEALSCGRHVVPIDPIEQDCRWQPQGLLSPLILPSPFPWLWFR